MRLSWYQSESTVCPQDIETYKDCVLLHRNIIETERDDALFYEYEEARLSQVGYAQYLAEKNAANIDYLSMELEVDL